jgi:hypothetical protein
MLRKNLNAKDDLFPCPIRSQGKNQFLNYEINKMNNDLDGD